MITQKQIAALKYLIFNAKNGTELSKRILAFLIDRSEGLTREVCLTLIEDREGYTKKEIDSAARGVGGMISCNCTTHLSALASLSGSELCFSSHYGDFDPKRSGKKFSSAGIFAGAPLDMVTDPSNAQEGLPMRYTFWLAKKYYSDTAELVTATRADLDLIDLNKSGLYPNSE
jgi:hypothetical protein